MRKGIDEEPMISFGHEEEAQESFKQPQPEPEPALETSPNSTIPTCYLYEKLLETFDLLVESIVDNYTLSEFKTSLQSPNPASKDPNYNNSNNLNSEAPFSDPFSANIAEHLIHQLRLSLRNDFKTIFSDLLIKYGLKQNLALLTVEIEKSRVLEEFRSVVGGDSSNSANLANSANAANLANCEEKSYGIGGLLTGFDGYIDYLEGVVNQLNKVNSQMTEDMVRDRLGLKGAEEGSRDSLRQIVDRKVEMEMRQYEEGNME